MIKSTDQTRHYQKQMLLMAEESKTFIRINAEEILSRSNDEELGKWVKEQMLKKISDAEARIEEVKNMYIN
jgi:hypothetical protein